MRVEDFLFHEFVDGLSADLVDDLGEHERAHALIADARAGGERQADLARTLDERRHGLVRLAELLVVRQHVRQAAGVCHQMADLHLGLVLGRELRHVGRDAVLQRQLDESNARFDVGEITRTDVAQSQARLAAAKAGLSSAQAQLEVSRAGYAAVVGQTPGELAPEPTLAGLLPATVDQAFSAARKCGAVWTASPW